MIYRLIQILQSPFSNGHALLIMEGSPDVCPMLFRQMTDLLQVELFSVNPSALAHDRDYDIGTFKSDLVSCLITAGIKVNVVHSTSFYFKKLLLASVRQNF